MRLLCIVLLILSFCPGARAELAIELGTMPVIGLGGSWDRIFVGLGSDFSWRKSSVPRIDPWGGGVIEEDLTLAVVEPTLFVRLFLTQDATVRPFVVGKLAREIEIVDDFGMDRDALSLLGGFGVKVSVGEGVSVGGETGVRAVSHDEYKTVEGHFNAFLQYWP